MDEGRPTPDPALMALIARELATEAYTLEVVLVRYALSEKDFNEVIAPNPYYQKVLADYTKEWHSIGSTHRRVAFYAAAALEEKLPVLADRMGSRSSELNDAVNTAKLFRDLAGIAPPSPGAGAAQGSGFSISINFGNHKVAIETQGRERTADEIREDSERTIDLQAVPALPERNSEESPVCIDAGEAYEPLPIRSLTKGKD